MSYLGNTALSQEIRDRIESTFNQTKELAVEGNRQEALLGCDFILRLDPDFVPAKTLRERLQASDGPVDVAGLDQAAEALEASEDPDVLVLDDDELGNLDDLEDELPDLQITRRATDELTPEWVLHSALRDLLEKRELKRLVQVAEENREEVANDPDLRKLVEEAYSRLEAEPYLEDFLGRARQAISRRDFGEAESLLHKLKALDATHPGVVALAEELGAGFRPPESKADRQRSVPTPPEASSPYEVLPPVLDEPRLEPHQEMPSLAEEPALFSEDPPPVVVDPPRPASQPLTPMIDPGSQPMGALNSLDSSEDRIRELLAEGQTAMDQGHHQSAIDSWSRIFLIDIDHKEAAERVEQARRLMAEGERKVEEVYQEALAANDAGHVEAARRGFEEVLQLQPSHMAAQEFLDYLGREPQAAGSSVGAPALDDVAASPFDELSLGDEGSHPGLGHEILVPPGPGGDPAAPIPGGAAFPAPKVVAKDINPLRKFILIGGVVLALLAVAGVAVWTQRDVLFPNTQDDASVGGPDLIARASSLHERGKLDKALKVLSEMSVDHPRYDEADELMALWREELEAKVAESEETVEDTGPSEAETALRGELLRRARSAVVQGEFIVADRYLRRADSIQELSDSELALKKRIADALEPLRQQIELVGQRDWEFVLPALWSLHQDDPKNRDVIRMMVNSYYNLGVRDLQRGNAVDAQVKFIEALNLRPGDDEVERHRRFAETYSKRSKDLLYRIYVKYIPFR